MHEVISGRLYTARKDVFDPGALKGASVVVDLSGDPKMISKSPQYIYMYWDMPDDVDGVAFSTLVRMCAGMMKVKALSVLLVGHKDTIDVLATCIVMEYLGCKPKIALGIVRENRTNCMDKGELVETVVNYTIS